MAGVYKPFPGLREVVHLDDASHADFDLGESSVGDLRHAPLDFGPELGIKTSSAADHEVLPGGRAEGPVRAGRWWNFPPRQIANYFSEVLTLGVILGAGDIVLVHLDRDVPLGTRIA